MTKKRFDVIREHFEEEANIFDENFYKIAPHYRNMIAAAAEALPFGRKEKLKILDLGCGTGNLTKEIIARFPNAAVTCVDMAENMLKMAKAKFKGSKNITFWHGDIRDFDYKEKYHAIVSSLVLHHIQKKEKVRFYKKLRACLVNGGAFVNADVLKSPDKHIQNMFIAKWREFACNMGITDKQFKELLVRHKNEDRPVTMECELEIMRKAGCKNVEVILRFFYFSLYCGKK
jgi:tRNA (cmo5U34)-methyltransferase